MQRKLVICARHASPNPRQDFILAVAEALLPQSRSSRAAAYRLVSTRSQHDVRFLCKTDVVNCDPMVTFPIGGMTANSAYRGATTYARLDRGRWLERDAPQELSLVLQRIAKAVGGLVALVAHQGVLQLVGGARRTQAVLEGVAQRADRLAVGRQVPCAEHLIHQA